MNLTQQLEAYAKAIVDDIRFELRVNQDHYVTGETDRALSSKVLKVSGLLSMQAFGPKHIEELERAIPAREMARRRYTEAEVNNLIFWALRKGIVGNYREGKRFIINVINAWRINGKPTLNSRLMSPTGRRTKAIEYTINRNKNKYDQKLTDIFNKAMDEALSKFGDRISL